jgi:nucleotide-binding universal stress UspA family protein
VDPPWPSTASRHSSSSSAQGAPREGREAAAALAAENQRLAKALDGASRALRVVEDQMNQSGAARSVAFQRENAQLLRAAEAAAVANLQKQLREVREKLARTARAAAERAGAERAGTGEGVGAAQRTSSVRSRI